MGDKPQLDVESNRRPGCPPVVGGVVLVGKPTSPEDNTKVARLPAAHLTVHPLAPRPAAGAVGMCPVRVAGPARLQRFTLTRSRSKPAQWPPRGPPATLGKDVPPPPSQWNPVKHAGCRGMRPAALKFYLPGLEQQVSFRVSLMLSVFFRFQTKISGSPNFHPV